MFKKISFISIVTSTILICSNAQSATYQFYQGGFEEGASISGSFTGVDLNDDGRLTGGQNYGEHHEITDFSMTFSGNSIVSATDHFSLANLFGLVYDLNGGLLGDRMAGRAPEHLMTNSDPLDPNPNSRSNYGFHPGQTASLGYGFAYPSFDGPTTSSNEFITVTSVPVPGAIYLYSLALIMLAKFRSKKSG